ncbi:orotate phosphoribosyltransferase [Candidatus Bathyarchaeota archaeon]|nr:orotate phosphoribosyltransferase [Candidatus Bathyarchaeota archaeon]
MAWTTEKERLKAELCTLLTRIGALKFGTFTLSGGKLSTYYVDMRIVPSFPEAFKTVENVYMNLAENDVGLDSFARIAGIPTAGVPFASVLAYLLHKPFLYVRQEAKSHGRERQVEGILHPGDKVLVVDDLVTSGGSLLNAVDAIISEGGLVENALVLIDREEGGKEALKSKKISLSSIASMSEVAQLLYSKEVITKHELSSILGQIKKTP